MSKTKRVLKIAAMPVVAVGIYAWMIRAAYRDLATMWRHRHEGDRR